MAKDNSFDIVSKPNLQEIDNAVNMAMKEILNRYDFKGSQSKLTLETDKIVIIADDDYKLKSVIDILHTKLAKRGVLLKFLEYGKKEEASGGTLRQEAKINQGISQDQAKEINKKIKALGLKVQTQIQGDQIRVSAKKIDDLQTAIQTLKAADFPIALQFINYR